LATATLNPTTDDFAALFEESFSGSGMIEGRVVAATVTGVGGDFITVDVGLKTEGRIPVRDLPRTKNSRLSAKSSRSISSASRTRWATPSCRATRPAAKRHGRASSACRSARRR